jgi:hypothetical protein
MKLHSSAFEQRYILNLHLLQIQLPNLGKVLGALAFVGFRTNFVRTNFVRTNFVRTNFVRTNFVRTNFVRTNSGVPVDVRFILKREQIAAENYWGGHQTINGGPKSGERAGLKKRRWGEKHLAENIDSWLSSQIWQQASSPSGGFNCFRIEIIFQEPVPEIPPLLGYSESGKFTLNLDWLAHRNISRCSTHLIVIVSSVVVIICRIASTFSRWVCEKIAQNKVVKIFA